MCNVSFDGDLKNIQNVLTWVDFMFGYFLPRVFLTYLVVAKKIGKQFLENDMFACKG